MRKVYLDNAATTPILPEVIEVVSQQMAVNYGNPSSTHQVGRNAKAAVETARKNIAKLFNAQASEIIFTAGATEADNLILINAVLNLGVQRIISSKIEHHAILHTLDYLKSTYNTQIDWVDLDENGHVEYKHLEELLAENVSKTLVSLMYVNNEIGTLLNLNRVSALCTQYSALFHSDAVQAIGHFAIDVQKTPIDFFVSSAHKYHGPKGVGFAYIKRGHGITSIIHGGEQEKGARAGTENVHNILGMEKALQIACDNLEKEQQYIQSIKSYFIEQLTTNFEGIQFNGASNSIENSSYIILNVRFPKSYPMLIFNLDLKGICVSGGSACQSGSAKGSHVLQEILSEKEAEKTSIRFSFSKFIVKEDIDYVIDVLKSIL